MSLRLDAVNRSPRTMADTTTTAPMPDPAAADQVGNVTNEQDINPWSVTGAQDESGEVAAIDYLNLAKYDPCKIPRPLSRLCAALLTYPSALQEMEHFGYR